MKAQTKFFTAAAATAIAGLVSAAPAQAITFGPGLIQGDGSKVNFTFYESHGSYQSQWGVYNKSENTFHNLFTEELRQDPGEYNMGTCGITIADIEDCQASFTFEEGKEYAFFLRNIGEGDHRKTMFSANELNPIQGWTEFKDQTKFFSDLSVLEDERYQSRDDSPESDLATRDSETVTLENGKNALIAFDDLGIDSRGTGDYFHGDWNDFLVTATVTVPEPATLLGLGVVAGAMTLSRRRKNDKAA